MPPLSSLSAVDRVERVLKLPAPESLDEAAWHEAVTPALFPDDGVGSARLMELGVEIVRCLPFERLSTSLDRVSGGNGAIEDIRQIRKLLLVGRDTLVLSAIDTSSDDLDPIFELSRALGRVADTGGQKRSAVEASRASLEDLRAMGLPDLYDVSDGVLKHRCTKHLCTGFLLDRSTGIEESVFHNARKSFRRVVHLAIVACAEKPTTQLEELVAAGKEINMRYGSFHRKLLKKAA